MARLTHAESQARTRDRLIAAAARVFARRGFHGASVDEIADEAELTKGAVYSNFASKDELFLGVVETCLQPPAELYRQLEAQANEQTEGDVASPPRRLGDLEEIWCLLQIEFWLYALRNPPVPDRMAALYRQFRAQLAPIAGPYATEDVEAEEVAGVAIALTLQWRADPGAIRPDLVARVLRALQRSGAANGRVREA